MLRVPRLSVALPLTLLGLGIPLSAHAQDEGDGAPPTAAEAPPTATASVDASASADANALAVDADGEADEAEAKLDPKYRLHWSALLAFRLNPQGLALRPDLAYRVRLFDDPHPVLKDAYFGIGPTASITPAEAEVGPQIEIKPLSVLLLGARYMGKGYYGSFQTFSGFESARDEHSDTTLDEIADADGTRSETATEFGLHAQALAKVGPIALRNDFWAFRTDAGMEGDEHLYYHTGADTLVPDKGWFFTNDTDLVFLSDFGLVAGVRNHLTFVDYGPLDFRDGESQEDLNSPIWRIGPLLAYVFYDDPEMALNRPTILAIVNWYIDHRYRTGADVSQAIPYFVLGVRAEGDLIKSDD